MIAGIPTSASVHECLEMAMVVVAVAYLEGRGS
jgi:hypothetical protein